MSDKLDPMKIMQRLRQLLADCEREMQQSDWHLHIHLSAHGRPPDGSAGVITFSVGTEPSEDEEDYEGE